MSEERRASCGCVFDEEWYLDEMCRAATLAHREG